jgi:catechol 2,3-dioxygenase-like lactoylglutathione lyase family enzyme
MATMGAVELKVSNVILRVSDLGRSLGFYRDRVGMKVRFSSAEFVGLDGGGVTLMLTKPSAPPRGENAGLSALTEIVLEVDDIASAHRTLKERGVPFRVEPRPVTSDGKRDLLATDFQDPDGHLVSLTGWVPRAAP